ncbi:hypothetical protein VOLCADRAFT_107203 [Volvox carteri f. nagariensis]|uniref:Nucleoplasmin-like domain-containing protein n=1 Tax=Volvox carteri f. nagariensis TaxID=3068 RepID=D8UCK5_VOLCA|nr:uncharacterized protein VOLCADRAFT_107203 [Volvox carteri f. nagariensis]EFJ42508.1 hypothetical protein VOLCADRAFT_107203 [Volvox carteri f. nagariensis]|eukprot:XP_002956364.1 hypothetical protein VOLCADRAFT_107203 [Volvox carteri f. nagariensis]
MAEAMAFWSVILPPKGKPVQQEVESTPTVLSSIHVTGLSLGVAPKDGPHVVTLEYNGTNTVLATLEAPHTRQWRLDIAIDQTIQMCNMGNSEVHVYGYQVSTPVRLDDSDEDDSDEDEEDYELEGDEGDEEVHAEAVAKAKGAMKKAALPAKGRPAKAAAVSNHDAMDTDGDEEDEEDEDEDEEEGESEEDEDEDEEGDGIPDMKELGSDDLIGEAADEDAEDEDEDEDESDGEEDDDEAAPVKVGNKRGPQTPQPGKPAKQPKQEPPKSAPPKALQRQKAAAAVAAGGGAKQIPVKAESGKPQTVKVTKDGAAAAGAPGATKAGKAEAAAAKAGTGDASKGKADVKGDQKPEPEKKKAEVKDAGKTEGKGKDGKEKKADVKDTGKAGDKAKPQGKQAAAGAAASPKAGVKTPGSEEEYRTALVDFLGSQKGPVMLSQIGSAVKKPAGVDKLANFLKKHSDTFAVEVDKAVAVLLEVLGLLSRPNASWLSDWWPVSFCDAVALGSFETAGQVRR